jgi:ribosomal protein S19E (S16A)
MATEKQILANQQNAQHSTGPRTESGRRRSRRNAIRHGLTAETIIDTLEDAADYRAFERAIKSDYSPPTAIEDQLVTRLASLLWRLRRAVTVESGLLTMQAGMTRNRNAPTVELNTGKLSIFRQFLRPIDLEGPISKQQEAKGDIRVDSIHPDRPETDQTNIARSFLQLASLENRVFERLGRYEASLWRQTAQILLLLSSIEFRPKDNFADERPQFKRVRKRNGHYPPFGFDPFWRSAGRLR